MNYTALLLGFTENIAVKYCCNDFYIFALLCVANCIVIKERGL